MYQKFESLNQEKKMRIINASFQAFAGRQFKDASTDEIAKNAQISKGALFQYFGSKRQLYSYMYHYAYDLLLNEFWGQADFSHPDLIDRVREVFAMKMNLYLRYPKLFEFIITLYTRETDQEISKLKNHGYDTQRAQANRALLENIDTTRFRQEYDAKLVISIILWTIEGYANAEMAKLQQEALCPEKYEQWMAELDQYLKAFKKAFYKEETEYGKCD